MRRLPIGPALAALVLLTAALARADVAATGRFDIDLNGSPPSLSFTGDISFDPGARTALGRTVNMEASVGDMTFEGDALIDVIQRSATFTLTAESAGDFDFTSSGAATCEAAGCVNGRAVFAGRLTTTGDPDQVLIGGVFTVDGTVGLDAGGAGTGGSFAINAFPLTLTRAGADIAVSSGPQTFFDTARGLVREFVADARFPQVDNAGATQFVAFSGLPGALPAGVALDPAVSVFVDVASNAMVTGGVRLCLGYADADVDGTVDGTAVAVARLRLLHAASIGGAFSDVTALVANGRACGDVAAVGPIVLAVGPEGATTTTTLAPGETTTTTTPGSATTTTTLPGCFAALECLDASIAEPLCPGETVSAKLGAFVAKKFAKARTALLAARSATAAKRIAKLLNRARKQLAKIDARAGAFASKRKGPISEGCRDRIRALTGRVTEQIAANQI